MAIIDRRGFVDDGTNSLTVAGTSTFSNAVTNTSYDAAKAITDWYVDWVSGSDGNAGTTAAHPVKTVMGGVVAKWGTTSPILSQSTTIHFLSSQPLGAEAIVLEPIMVGMTNFVLSGALSSPTRLTLGTVYSKNRPSNVALQARGFTGRTPGQLVVNNTHPSKCFIDSVTGDVATLTQPFVGLTPNVDVAYNPIPTMVDTWTTGDSVSVYNLPTINLAVMHPRSEQGDFGTVFGASWLQNLHLLDASGNQGASIFGDQFRTEYVVVADCWIEPYIFTNGANYSFTLVDCWFNGGNVLNTMVLGGACNTYGIVTSFPSWLDGDFRLNQPSSVSGVGQLGFVNANAQLIVHPASTAEIRLLQYADCGLWGSGSLAVQATGAVWNHTASPWVHVLMLTGSTLNSATTGSSYSLGTFTDGRALTPANLDVYGSLIDVLGGSRFTK